MKTVMEQMNHIGFRRQVDETLRRAYREALKKQEVKELVLKLKMDEDILMKYTSSLEDSAVECQNCKGCKSLTMCRNKIDGYIYLPILVDGKLEFSYRACKYQQKKLQEDKYLDNMYLFDVAEDIKKASMKDIYVDDKQRFPAIKWLNDFMVAYRKDKHQRGLYLHGSFGSGKSYMIAAMFHELAKENVKSAIIFWPEYLRELKASFGTDFKEKFEVIKKVPLLLIDDLGAENTTAWGRDEILCSIVQYRMQELLPTFFTSNLNKVMLEEHLSVSKGNLDEVKARRIMKRIEQLTDDIELVSVNLRH